MDDLFGVPLQRDPSVALPPFSSGLQEAPGPIHRVQFVIELVGPRSVAAYTASMLLDPGWYSALGQPQLWKMSPADQTWQPLTDTRDGSYDSLALAWDMVSEKGTLSSQAAQHLLTVAERFGQACDRRALPLPMPNEVDVAVRRLQTVQAEMDGGMALLISSRHRAIAEKDAWITCAALGLEFDSAQGAFVLRDGDTGLPLAIVSPSTEDSFSLGNVQTGQTHEALMVGFAIVSNPAPVVAVDACFRIADELSRRLYAEVLDETNVPLNQTTKDALRRSVQTVDSALRGLGLPPGGRGCRLLWPDSF